ncbi:MAG: DUF814 domain-containing protein [Gemmatimonadales bacterium]|jgi:hypothetical protein|nr:MAG: DUF814 domain-containing protein [Gemmatimonadales bacterium]
MRIQWDAALVGATARVLDARFSGCRIRAHHLDPVLRRAVVFLREAVLVWDLHPERTGLRVLDPGDPPPEATALPARLTRVWAPPDDRVMVLEWRRIRGRPPAGRLVLELLPNQENVLVTEGPEETIRSLLRTREGERSLRRGHPYTFPPPSRRQGIEEDPGPDWWRGVLAAAEPGQERREVLRAVAWSSPLVMPHLLAPGGYGLWQHLRSAALALPGSPVEAAVLSGPHGPQPYPVPLAGRTLARTVDLLEAFREAEQSGRAGAPETLIPGALVDALEAETERARTRTARLEEELSGLPDPAELQAWGDLILARFHLVPEGRSSVELEGFDGTTVTVPLDPGAGPDANARRHYDRAARVRRAIEELPGRIDRARAAWDRLRDVRDRATRGEASREEIEAVIPRRDTPVRGGSQGGPSPFRRYRSSGGLEIRVGRGAAGNDELTFHHSKPNEIWLHARHAAGAHVILRWSGEGSPPPGDLREAAVLAALHSRARTSGSVPVDWTRRKYVRKPRKAAAGSVIPERVKTVFVQPDETLEERLREE